MFELVLEFELFLTTESEETTDMRVNLNMLVLHQGLGSKVNTELIIL
jgi:hypothetical protein